MTEITSAASATYDSVNDIGSVGIPLVKTNCMIADPNTNLENAYNQEGELCFQGPSLMLGYYNRKKDTDEIIKKHEDGEIWLHTGDIGYINNNGEVYVTGRMKRIVMTKDRQGQVTKLFPDRIEKSIYLNDAVELCCVIGVRCKERIHYPKAFVILKNKADIDQVKGDILNLCKQNLPEYMIPEEIEVVDDLPRTQRGKIDYRALESASEKSAEMDA